VNKILHIKFNIRKAVIKTTDWLMLGIHHWVCILL